MTDEQFAKLMSILEDIGDNLASLSSSMEAITETFVEATIVLRDDEMGTRRAVNIETGS